MPSITARKQKSRRRPATGASRKLIAVGLVLSLMAACAILAQRLSTPPAATRSPQPSSQVTAASLSPNSPSKEYVYASGRLVATEEPPGACTMSLLAPSRSFAASGGTDTVAVAPPAGCGWSAQTDSTWIFITSSGGTALSYSVSRNTNSARRSGLITIKDVPNGRTLQTLAVLQGAAFADVAETHPFYTQIGKLSAMDITSGCNPSSGLYCPQATLTREEMAVFFVKALGQFDPPLPQTNRFQDVPTDRWSFRWVEDFATRSITSGCSINPPLFCPTDLVSREQMAIFLEKSQGRLSPPTPPAPQQTFLDVDRGRWSFTFVENFVRQGSATGPLDQRVMSVIRQVCSADGLHFCPGGAITRGEAAALIVIAFNL